MASDNSRDFDPQTGLHKPVGVSHGQNLTVTILGENRIKLSDEDGHWIKGPGFEVEEMA